MDKPILQRATTKKKIANQKSQNWKIVEITCFLRARVPNRKKPDSAKTKEKKRVTTK